MLGCSTNNQVWKERMRLHTLASVHPKTLFPQLRSQQHRTSVSFLSFCGLGWLMAFVIGLSSSHSRITILLQLTLYLVIPECSFSTKLLLASTPGSGFLPEFPSGYLEKPFYHFLSLIHPTLGQAKNIIRLPIVPKP